MDKFLDLVGSEKSSTYLTHKYNTYKWKLFFSLHFLALSFFCKIYSQIADKYLRESQDQNYYELHVSYIMIMCMVL